MQRNNTLTIRLFRWHMPSALAALRLMTNSNLVGDPMSRHQRIDHCAMAWRKNVGHDHKTSGQIVCQCGDRALSCTVA